MSNPAPDWCAERLVCRPALPGDTPAVLALASQIWDGNDYLPYVWESWLAAPHNHLFIAMWGRELAGTINLKDLGAGHGFLAALRVHPLFQGRKFSNHLFEYALAAWSEMGGGELRLVTHRTRKVVHHLCEKFGFWPAAEIWPWIAPPLAGGPAPALRPLAESSLDTALRQLQENPLLPPSLNLIDLAWEYCPPQRSWLALAAVEGRGFSWRDGQGVLTFFFDEYDGLKFAYVESIACQLDDLADLLLDARAWAAENGCQNLTWNPPNLPVLQPQVLRAGFELAPEKERLVLFQRSG